MGRCCGHGRSGSLLVITLWLITILAVLAVAIGRYLSVELRVATYRLAREQAASLARSGVYLAMQRLALDANSDETYDWLGDDWALSPDADLQDPTTWVVAVSPDPQDSTAPIYSIEIRMTDEERRLDVNSASQSTLEGLLTIQGVQPELAVTILDYRDPDEEGLAGDPPVYPKNAPLAVLEELREISDVREVFDTLQPQLTASLAVSTLPLVNINTASREVLLALGANPLLVDSLTVARPGLDGRLGTDDDCKATDQSTIAQELGNCAFAGDQSILIPLATSSNASIVVRSMTFRVHVEARVGPQPVRQIVEAVVRRQDGGAWPTIIAWREG